MTKLIWKLVKLSPVAVAASLLAANTAIASEVEKVTSVANLAQESNSLGQVTSVSQFSDVQPTDWAFQALQSLVERYGCIAGYPNGTYRGNRALTRYEFAAGLNACLDRVNELIATSTAELVSKDDLATLQRLQEEFSAEIATLRGRVDSLEARTDEVEANQFSTTAKLKGEAIFNLTNAWGDEVDSNTNLGYRARLSFESSFSGKDKLQVRMTSSSIEHNNGQTGTRMSRLGFAGSNDNNVAIDKVNYKFNLGDKLAVKVDASGAEVYENINNFNPVFKSSGGGAISRYGRFSPIYRVGSGGSGVTATYNPKGKFSVSAAYLAREGSDPTEGAGVTQGDNAFFGQVDFKPSDNINVGLTYARSYNGASGGFERLMASTGSNNANRPFGSVATEANHYGVQAAFRLGDKTTLAGWYGIADAQEAGGENDADINYWAATLGIKDFGKKGNTLGFIFGQPPKVTENTIEANEDSEGTSYHLEALYKMKINDRVAVTPGLLVIFNPEHNDTNDTIYVGTVRTTFKF